MSIAAQSRNTRAELNQLRASTNERQDDPPAVSTNAEEILTRPRLHRRLVRRLAGRLASSLEARRTLPR
jgi:hypothetical protein